MAKGGQSFREYLKYSTIGIEMGLSVLVGLFLGKMLDDFFGTQPWLLLLFLLFGMAAGFRSIFRLARKTKETLGKKEEERP